ncbi:MAG: hypothetical protein EAZ55_02060 [Cytophagales bacterium]|nr:MAG: hypothetical protein EAZ55_02060 [Cytophagales bacterium]
MLRSFIFIVTFCLSLYAAQAQPEIQKKIQRQLIMTENNQTITIEAGTFEFTSSLSMEGKNQITIKGQGIDKTILSFKNQTEGAEGLKISNCQNIIIENLTIQDTKGDCIKTMEVKGITFRNVKAEWTGEPSEKNGAYGLYPVMCENVLIEGCIAIGASDAGIYVGQSKYIVVKNSKAYHNVAGIEIENSIDAEVYDNEAYENTGGILVFDLPDLVQKRGGNVRVYNNHIHHNNFPNFAPKGNIVGKVPAGTGVLILATNEVEVYKNKILYNNSIGTGIISYYMTENPIQDSLYYPYPTKIYIHDNEYQRDEVKFIGKGRMGLLFKYKLKYGKQVPDIVYDGIVDEKKQNAQICIKNNSNATFGNIDAGNDFKNNNQDLTPYDCEIAIGQDKERE